ncbi:hypothetical protein F4821DRAFT_115653 [Hypoxylon rubiginosum]|uniref:Uncharacterized protein n=1 Tax=Hypoxylon rubiginosum TaxID=110542 RepID=A0ACC0D3Q9_9PEZI|nr:hypothetical protein F4821DRAFT_115653 [Hypoxylon rubiginosum]
MLPINSTVGLGQRALLHTRVPPRGTCSRIISLRLHRRSRVPSSVYGDKLSQCQYLSKSTRGIATTTTPSADVISDHEFLLFRDLLTRASPKPRIEHGSRHVVPSNRSLGAPEIPAAASSIDELVEREHFPNPFQKALKALQQRDTRRLLLYLKQIVSLSDVELRELVATIPRTTFTEFLRSLDPLCVARDVDPTGPALITVGVYQVLNMQSAIDDWGVRKIYSQLLQRMLVLAGALKDSGQALQIEEYICLLRCAGAASDPAGAKLLWDDLRQSQASDWRHSEAFTEFISARFLTRPLYTSHDKARRMVTPRNLHRSRLLLSRHRVYRLDRLRFDTRRRKLNFGLIKDQDYAEDLMRMLRKKLPPSRLIFIIKEDGYRINESLLCALMVAYGRVGSLRYIGSRILNDYFGIRMERLTYNKTPDIKTGKSEIENIPYRIRPTIRLMQAVVETYGSNGEIAVAFQLVDHISKTYHIKIPLSIWQDLLEWTYIMSCPPTSTAWKLAGMHSKIPSSSAVELIWNTMTSAPYHVQPSFDQYNIMIRSLLGRRQFRATLPLMRQAVHLYDAKCREYEEAVLGYVETLRDGVYISEAITTYERARFAKARMHHDIQTWCRQFLSNVRSFDPANTLSTTAVPDFVGEFRPFIMNPARYRTATGYVSLFDPGRENTSVKAFGAWVHMAVPMKHRRTWIYQGVKAKRFGGLSSNSLAGNAPVSKLDLVSMLTSTSRAVRQPRPAKKQARSDGSVSKSSETAAERSYDDDDDYF